MMSISGNLHDAYFLRMEDVLFKISFQFHRNSFLQIGKSGVGILMGCSVTLNGPHIKIRIFVKHHFDQIGIRNLCA